MPMGATCDLPPPEDFSTDKDFVFYKQAQEVDDDVRPSDARTQGGRPLLVRRRHAVDHAARPLDSDRVPNLRQDNLPLDKRVDLLARLGVVTADAFIGCWQTKYPI